MNQPKLALHGDFFYRKKPDEDLEKARWLVDILKRCSPTGIFKDHAIILKTLGTNSLSTRLELSLDYNNLLQKHLNPLGGLLAGLAYTKPNGSKKNTFRLGAFTKFSDMRYLDYLSSNLGYLKILDAELCPVEILEDLAFFLVDHKLWFSSWGWDLAMDMQSTLGINSREELILKMNLAGFKIPES